LLARGETHIRILDCRASPLFASEPNVEFMQGDVRNPADCERAMKGIDVVFHTVAILSFYTRWSFDVKESVDVTIVGTANILAAAAKAGVKSFIHTSSNAVNFVRNAYWHDADETLPYVTTKTAPCIYGWTKAEAEKLVLAADGRSGMRAVAIRVSGIFGPRDAMVAGSFAVGTPAFVGEGNNLQDFCYVENLVHGHFLAEVGLATKAHEVGGEAFYILGTSAPYCYLLQALSRSFQIPLQPVPLALFCTLSIIFTYVYGFTRGLLPTGLMRTLQIPFFESLISENTYSCAKARRVLGYQPLYTLPVGAEFCAEFFRHRISLTS
jgi:sterol-4alpha-carboxylate 3-dehydrogenase (decarboxylating)